VPAATDIFIEELELGVQAYNVLKDSGVQYVDDVTRLSAEEPRALDRVRERSAPSDVSAGVQISRSTRSTVPRWEGLLELPVDARVVVIEACPRPRRTRYATTRPLAPERRQGPKGQRLENPCTVILRMARSPGAHRIRRHAVPMPDWAREQTVYSRGKRRRKRTVPLRGTKRLRDSRFTTQKSPHLGGESVMLTWSPGAIPFLDRGSYAWRKSIR
jgi:hypothetical protein